MNSIRSGDVVDAVDAAVVEGFFGTVRCRKRHEFSCVNLRIWVPTTAARQRGNWYRLHRIFPPGITETLQKINGTTCQSIG